MTRTRRIGVPRPHQAAGSLKGQPLLRCGGYVRGMTVQIKLIGQAEPVDWKDEKPARPSFREYAYRLLSSGALCIEVTVQNVDDQGHVSHHGTTPKVVYGPHAWEQVEGDGELGS